MAERPPRIAVAIPCYRVRDHVLDVIARVNRELGTTTIVITHNAAIAAMADRVVHFGDGRVVSIETNAVKKAAAELSW